MSASLFCFASATASVPEAPTAASIDLLNNILNCGVIVFGVRTGEEFGCVQG